MHDLLEAASKPCPHCNAFLFGAERHQTPELVARAPRMPMPFYLQALAFLVIFGISAAFFHALTPPPPKPAGPGAKRELIFYTMNGCRPCAGIKESLADPEVKAALRNWDVRIVKQGDSEARGHSIRGYPTLVAELNGREVGRVVGYRSPRQLKSWLDEF